MIDLEIAKIKLEAIRIARDINPTNINRNGLSSEYVGASSEKIVQDAQKIFEWITK